MIYNDPIDLTKAKIASKGITGITVSIMTCYKCKMPKHTLGSKIKKLRSGRRIRVCASCIEGEKNEQTIRS